MAVPGMQKLNIPKTNSAKAAIASNLSNKSAATGNASRGAFVSTNSGIFSATSVYANNRNTNSLGFAQRTAIGSGEHLNWKTYNSGIISADRNSLNAFRTPTFNNIGNFANVHNSNSGSTMDKIMAYGMLAASLGKLGAEAVNTVKSTKSSESNDPALKDNNAKTTSTPASITAMKDAKDSTTLRGAIETAQSDKATMESNLTQLESKLPQLKEASESATKQLEDLKPKIEAKQQEVKNKDAECKKQEEARDAAAKARDKALGNAKDMEKAVGDAAENYTKASEALVNAKATLASTPETITKTNADGTTTEEHNPAYDKAQEAVKQAEQQKSEAQKALDQAKQNHESAVNNYEKCIKEYENQAELVENAKGQLARATEEFEAAQKELNGLEKQQNEANTQIKEYTDALTQQKDLKENITKIDSEIKNQQTRLTKLETEEQKELEKTNKKMNGLADKISERYQEIDTTDGLNHSENRKLKKNGKNSDKYAELTDIQADLQRKVNYTKLAKTKGETINGKTFRTNSYNGETLYMIGAKKVDETQFNREINFAKNIENDKKALNNEINKNILKS